MFVASGQYSIDDVFEPFDRLVQEHRQSGRPPLPGILLDVRESESLLSRPASETRRVIAHFREHASVFNSRVGIVVRGHARYGLMRMATTWATIAGFDARVFWELEDGIAWLRQVHSNGHRSRV